MVDWKRALNASDRGLIIGVMFFASACTQTVSGILLDRAGPGRAGQGRPRHGRRVDREHAIGGIVIIVTHCRFLWLVLFSGTTIGPAISVIGLLSGDYMRERFGRDAQQLGGTVLVLLVALNMGGVIYGQSCV